MHFTRLFGTLKISKGILSHNWVGFLRVQAIVLCQDDIPCYCNEVGMLTRIRVMRGV